MKKERKGSKKGSKSGDGKGSRNKEGKDVATSCRGKKTS